MPPGAREPVRDLNHLAWRIPAANNNAKAIPKIALVIRIIRTARGGIVNCRFINVLSQHKARTPFNSSQMVRGCWFERNRTVGRSAAVLKASRSNSIHSQPPKRPHLYFRECCGWSSTQPRSEREYLIMGILECGDMSPLSDWQIPLRRDQFQSAVMPTYPLTHVILTKKKVARMMRQCLPRGSADLQSAVSPNCLRPGRRNSNALVIFHALRIENPGYGRVQLCATFKGVSPGRILGSALI